MKWHPTDYGTSDDRSVTYSVSHHLRHQFIFVDIREQPLGSSRPFEQKIQLRITFFVWLTMSYQCITANNEKYMGWKWKASFSLDKKVSISQGCTKTPPESKDEENVRKLTIDLLRIDRYYTIASGQFYKLNSLLGLGKCFGHLCKHFSVLERDSSKSGRWFGKIEFLWILKPSQNDEIKTTRIINIEE